MKQWMTAREFINARADVPPTFDFRMFAMRLWALYKGSGRQPRRVWDSKGGNYGRPQYHVAFLKRVFLEEIGLKP